MDLRKRYKKLYCQNYHAILRKLSEEIEVDKDQNTNFLNVMQEVMKNFTTKAERENLFRQIIEYLLKANCEMYQKDKNWM